MRYKNECIRLKKLLEGPRSVLLGNDSMGAASMNNSNSTGSLNFQLDKMINITEVGCYLSQLSKLAFLDLKLPFSHFSR